MARKSAATTTSGNGSPPKPASPKCATTGKSSRSPKSPRPKAGEGEVPARGSGGHSLVIVESPKKARSINKFLGPKYVVKASMGHVRDLPKRKLGLDVAHGYSPSYEIVPAKKETVGDLSARPPGPTSSIWRPTRTARARPSPGTCSRPSAFPTIGYAVSPFMKSPNARSRRPLGMLGQSTWIWSTPSKLAGSSTDS